LLSIVDVSRLPAAAGDRQVNVILLVSLSAAILVGMPITLKG
jgi:hypothetical protein